MPKVVPDVELDAMYAAYLAGTPVKQVAKAWGRCFQSIYRLFERRGLAVRPKGNPAPFVIFQGRRYALHKRTGYHHGSAKGSRLLHRDMWEAANGPVPDGFVVHHVNGDKLDNRLANLDLMSIADHSSHHKTEYWQRDQSTAAAAHAEGT